MPMPTPRASVPATSDWKSHRFIIGGADISVRIDPELPQAPSEIETWVRDTAETLVAFYGKFPVPAVVINVVRRAGNPVNSGVEYDGRRIDIGLDPAAASADLQADWRLTHEMFHLGFPQVARRYHYLEEGLSDYLEPIARARLGKLTERKVWRDFMDGIPQGIPSAGSGGLDGTRAWGPTYWGGCLFWLLVDLDIRQRSGNAHRLDDAIRAMISAGGNGGTFWHLEKVIAVGDAATGTGSIQRMHERFGRAWSDPELDELWQKLGVRIEHGALIFDDAAPLAAIRRSIAKPLAMHKPAPSD